MEDKIREILVFIYGEDAGTRTAGELSAILEDCRPRLNPPQGYAGGFPLGEGDSLLITYGDQFSLPGKTPLSVLKEFADSFLDGTVSGIHLLPFSPYSSDDGFSVIDYREVNADWGSWDDIRSIAKNYIFMADLVLNHCSKESPWFQAFLRGEEPYSRYFITVPEDTDVSAVFRPRTHPLLTKFDTAGGPRWVWTTFSDDQVDLNYADPGLLLEMIKIFLSYIEEGAVVVRLDAIAFLWKELGTSCLHHPKTHAVVRLLRWVVEKVCPWVIIITETNVPHKENLSYFGNGDEAHLVYQFALPPLLLDAFSRTDSRHLQEWAADIRSPGPAMSFFNFCASHDGTGVLPARGILSEEELGHLADTVLERGGYISYKATPAGEIPYELNINYFSAISEVTLSENARIRKFLASQSILLAMPGVPGIYVHSLIGSENYRAGVEESGIKRRINREKLQYETVREELSTGGTVREKVFSGFEDFLAARSSEKAFHPLAESRVIPTVKEAFALLRTRRDGDGPGKVLCLASLSPKDTEVLIDAKVIGMGEEKVFTDLLSGDTIFPSWEGPTRFSLELLPFEVLWLAYGRD